MLSKTVLVALALAGDVMSPGVSRELAMQRSSTISNVQYDLRLDVRNSDTASGTIVVRFRRSGPPGQDVILDFRGLEAGSFTANGRQVRPEFNGAHIRFPASAMRMGTNEIRLHFKTPVAASGASIIRVRDLTDGATYLYTLLVPADANLLFPCFDQPDLKARVKLTLHTPVDWTAVANGREERVDTTTTGVEWSFVRTQPISTYLIAFAAGPWRSFSANWKGQEMRVFVRASRAHEVEADSLLDINRRALDWLGEYFGRPYPFGKYDFVLTPAFPFGGMEHPGAVFYNEESFIWRERPTQTQRLSRHATIYHEVAHQWFGDYVTMRWFDDLWLKEGFATYMAARMQAAIDPASNAWKTFYLRNKPAAYDVDATVGTTPVWQELANLDQAKSNYGAIVYNKAPSVLKQLEYSVGNRAFQGGVRSFLLRHSYGNATWRDLLQSIGTSAGTSLGDWGSQYILRAGMPVVEQQVQVRNGSIQEVRLVQRQAQASLSGSGYWPIRTALLLAYPDGSADTLIVALRGRETVVDAARGRPAPAFVFANAGDHAYARIILDSASVRYLETHIGSIGDPLLRAMLWGAMWDRVRDARLAPGRFATMVMRELPGEKDEQLLNVLLARLARTLNAYMPDSSREILASAENVLFERMSDTSASYGIRKAHLDALISVAATPNALTRLDALLDSAQAAGADLRAPTRWSIVTSLISRDWVSARSRLSREIMRDSTTEGRRRAFVANAAWPDATVKRAYFERYFADASLNEDWATASLRAFNVPAQDSLTLPFLATALDSLQWIQKHRRIFYLGSWLSAFVDGQRSADALARVNEFLRENPQLPTDLRQKILQNADELERTVRIRRQYPATQNLPAAGREVTELIGRTTWCAGAVPCTSPGAR